MCAREKLRSEISNQVQEFLLSGGHIEVLGMQSESRSYDARFCRKPAAIDELGLHGLITE
jgi:hypothetical protein